MKANLHEVAKSQKLAMALASAGNLEDALQNANLAIKKNKENPISYFIKGRVLWEMLEHKHSLVAFKKCVALDSGNTKAKFYIGLLYLLMGKFEKGCRYYSFRHNIETLDKYKHIKQWSPTEKHGDVLLWTEQGVGDEIMFYQFLPLLEKLNFQFTLESDCRLHPLLSNNFSWLNLVGRGEELDLSRFSLQLPIGDLLKFFHRHISQIKPLVVKAPANQKVDAALKPYDTKEVTFVGISWLSMSSDHAVKRSAPIELFCASLDPLKHVIVNLQCFPPEKDLEQARTLGFKIIDGFDCYNDLSAVFALVSKCSKVITIDNAVAQFSGALGVETHVWLPKSLNWRVGLGKCSSIWYRSVFFNYLN